MQTEINVAGMHCQKCVDKIERFVGELEGISQIDVDLKAQKVRVVFDAPASEQAIKDAIADAGFEVQ